MKRVMWPLSIVLVISFTSFAAVSANIEDVQGVTGWYSVDMSRSLGSTCACVGVPSWQGYYQNSYHSISFSVDGTLEVMGSWGWVMITYGYYGCRTVGQKTTGPGYQDFYITDGNSFNSSKSLQTTNSCIPSWTGGQAQTWVDLENYEGDIYDDWVDIVLN
ncbi:hypothetical protein GF406_22180 [candidate division KSB1 bacterium]|nr:hypothetical protein [candidate division KSB1 bacterium]